MCFSAEASFVSAGVLIPAGVHCTRLALRKDRSLWPYAAIPIGLGVQQAFEGLVWVGLNHGQEWLVQSAARFYLLFVFAFWPLWISFVAVTAEKDPRRRKWCRRIAGANTLWFLAAYLPFVLFADFKVRTAEGSIRYENVDELIGWIFRLLYFLSAAIPLLITERWRLFRPVIVLAAVACVVSATAYERAFTSAWCFFSALLSGWIWWQMLKTPAGELRATSATKRAAG
ncbi:MAG: DUF6629 family protein [Planctomycetaceae bacterium]